MKTSNVKYQTSKKPQIPNSNHHSRNQTVIYPEIVATSWVLKEGENEKQSDRHEFDLEERTAKFGETIVRFSKKIPRDPTNNRLIDQLVGAGTSIGANYLEASEKVSKKDFRLSISHCVKEAKETKFFLRMVAASELGLADVARDLYREGHELHRIFASIYRKTGQ
jgi:four helix bundle protein